MSEAYTSKTLREIVRVLASRFVGMIVIGVVVLASVAAATWYAPKSYRSQINILAKPAKSGNPLEPPVTSAREQVSLFVAMQREIIMSDYAVASAILALGGEHIPPYEPPADGGEPDPKTAEWDRKVQHYISPAPGQRDGGHLEYLAKVKKRIEVVTPGGPDATFSQTFTIRVDWPEDRTAEAKDAADKLKLSSRQLAARRAHDFTAALYEAYRARSIRLETEQSREASAFFTKNALVDAQKNLDDAVSAMAEFNTEIKGDLLGVINLTSRYTGGAETGVASLTTRFQGEIDSLQDRKSEVAALLKEVQQQLAKPADEDIVVPDAITTKNPSVTTLQDKILTLKLSMNGLLSRYTEAYQEYKNTKLEHESAQAELRDEMKRHEERLQQELRVVDARLAKLAEVLKVHTDRADVLASKTAKYEQLRNAVTTAQTIFDKENERVVNAATAEKLAANPILVRRLDLPSRPDPDKPRRPIAWLNLLVAAVGAMVLALIYAFVADRFDPSIKSIDDAEAFLSVPVLASVPKLGWRIVRRTSARALRAAEADGRAVPRAQVKSGAQDLFRGLWASLFYSMPEADKSVLICSADRREGSSTIAAALALAGSTPAGSTRVALVDLNLRNPAIDDILGLNEAPGVAEIVLSGAAAESVAQPVSPALDVFTVGESADRELEILRSDALAAFLDGLRRRYDHVLVDAAPANQFADAQVLAKTVGSVVLVAHTEKTPRQALALAKKHIESSGAKVAGLVLNLRTYPIPKFLYRRV